MFILFQHTKVYVFRYWLGYCIYIYIYIYISVFLTWTSYSSDTYRKVKHLTVAKKWWLDSNITGIGKKWCLTSAVLVKSGINGIYSENGLWYWRKWAILLIKSGINGIDEMVIRLVYRLIDFDNNLLINSGIDENGAIYS